MQFSLQDVRKWGFIKIGEHFKLRTKEDIGKLYKSKDGLSLLLSTEKSRGAYSIPAKWGTIKDNLDHYYGFVKFMDSVEPMIELTEVDDICKRRFRNMWDVTWKNYVSAFSCDTALEAWLSETGTKLAFISSDKFEEVGKEVYDFFNAILIWSIFTQQEVNFSKNSIDVLDLITLMIKLSNEDFIYGFVFDTIGD